MQKNKIKIYQSLYSQNKQTWENSERRKFIENVCHLVPKPIRALDVGCGRGLHSSWIGDAHNNEWVGVDIVNMANLGLRLPKNGTFIKGNILNKSLVSTSRPLNKPFNLVIDQGAVLVELSGKKRDNYLDHIRNIMTADGIFVAFIMLGKEGEEISTPDGRRRVFCNKKTLKNLKNFELLDCVEKTYKSDSPKNPFKGRNVRVAHIILKKK